MDKNPFQKKIWRKHGIEEISYVDFSNRSARSRSFFLPMAYGETCASEKWIRSRMPMPSSGFSLEYITDGECIYSDGGVKRILRTGELFFFKDTPTNQQSANSRTGLKKRYVSLAFNRMFERIFDFQLENFLAVRVRDPERVQQLFDQIKKLVTEGDPHLDSELSGRVYQLFYEWEQSRSSPEFTDEISSMLSVINFSPERFPNFRSLQTEFKMSRYALCRIFHENLHTTPMEYVIRQRFGKACWHLEYQSMPVNVVASLCGFRNVPFFINGFRRRFGMSPGEFRKQKQHPEGLSSPL